jgi:hypothetical protein
MILSVCRAGDEKRWEGANFNITNERKSMANSGAGTAYPSGAHEFTRGFIGVGVTRSFVLYVCFVDRCLSFCTFSFGHCVVCSSSIYGF